jgi:hypothetical protein
MAPHFGAESELLLRTKEMVAMTIPATNSSAPKGQGFNFDKLKAVARVLRTGGSDAAVHELGDEDEPINHSRWNIVFDGSLSR